MSADVLTPAILQYIDHNAYPDSEDVASADLGTDALSSLLEALHNAQTDVEQEVKALSQNTAPDIDTWITRAKDLQADILRSRETARQIVAEHEANKDLRAKGEEAGRKVQLLEKEVAFEETLAGTLEHVAYANDVLDAAQEHAVVGNVKDSLREIEEADASIAGLEGLKDTRACGLLQTRASQLRQSLCETTTEFWNSFVEVHYEERTIVFTGQGLKAAVEGAVVPVITFELMVTAAKGLGIFDSLMQKMSKDIDRTIIKPRLMTDDDGQVAKVTVSENELSCTHRHGDISHDTLFADLQRIVDFFASHLPAEVGVALSQSLIPAMSLRLEDHWLEPAVPLNIKEMPAFQDMLMHVSQLADRIERHGWRGTKQLRVWVQNAPRTWLTKRREAVLGDVRNLVFAGLRETKVVERVETQMVSKDDHQALLTLSEPTAHTVLSAIKLSPKPPAHQLPTHHISPRLANRQLKFFFHILRDNAYKDLLNWQQQTLRSSPRKEASWLPAFCVTLGLAMVLEEIQRTIWIQADAKAKKDAANVSREQAETEAVNACQRIDGRFGLLVGLFQCKYRDRKWGVGSFGNQTPEVRDPVARGFLGGVMGLLLEKQEHLRSREKVSLASENQCSFTSRLVARFLLPFLGLPA
ncbi:ribosome biogenesis protein ytm1 [Friedmanniomyces endolithicus]|nr:ribosome biogenesis protein ytm1 [Friedmanniomyces endolithicus]